MKIWRPYTQMFNHKPDSFLEIESAKGSYINLKNGKKCLDGISSWWLITHGHCHPQIVEAIQKQSEKIDQIIFANFSHSPSEELAEELAKILPKKLDTLFFSDNGSTAVEVSIKMALQYWQQVGNPEKNRILAFDSAYHGDTCGAMSVSGKSHFNKPYEKLQFNVCRIKQGHYLHEDEETWLSDFKKQLEKNHDKIAAIIIEPLIQGAGGMIIWPPKILKKLVSLCKIHNVLVIFDEVMTGFGRTGSMFAFEQVNYTPDFLCLSKGLTGGMLPMALTVTTNKIYKAFLSKDPYKMLFHGHSFTANPIACSAAVANLKVYKEENTLLNIKHMEIAHTNSLRQLKTNLGNLVKDVRVLGSIGVLELNLETQYGGNFSKTFFEACLSLDLLVRPLGNVVYLMPPFSTTSSEIEMAWNKIAKVCKKFQ